MSKEIKPKQRIGQVPQNRLRRFLKWGIMLAVATGGGIYAYRYAGRTVVEIPTAKVRKAEFVIAVKTRGEIRSTNSVILAAPQVPDPKITRLAESGKAYVKLSAPYRTSVQSAPYSDIAPYAHALVAAAPGQLVWGTDWPHVMLDTAMPNDADLCDLLAAWVPAAATRNRILVDNPARLYGFRR